MNTTPKTIKFFDFDSITSKKDIEKNSLEYIHFSEGFASPEQLTGDKKHISEKTDIYAFGAMLYYVLFGKNYDYIKEFTGDSIPYSTMRFPDHQPKLEEKLNKFFSKTLAILPEDRFENMTEVRDQLDELIGASGSLCDQDRKYTFHNFDDDMEQKLSDPSCPSPNSLFDEFESIARKYDPDLLGRYIVLIKYLAQKGFPKHLVGLGEISDKQYLEHVAKTYADIKGEITADDLCLGIWAEYNLFAFFGNNEALKKCSELYDKYTDAPHDGKYPDLMLPFVYLLKLQKQIADEGQSNRSQYEDDLLRHIKEHLINYSYPENNTVVRDILSQAIDKFKSDPRRRILRQLLDDYRNTGRDEIIKAAENFSNDFMPNDDFAERLIKSMANIKGDEYEIRIIPKQHGYDEVCSYDKAAGEELVREFQKQIGVTLENLQK